MKATKMASYFEMWQIFLLFFATLSVVDARIKAVPIKLTDQTWTDILEGEWLVKFYAPWCPACKALTATWEDVAGWSDDINIKVAQIDLTENPGLSGRFLITALPTIYHVKDGEFRMYRGARDASSFISFVDDQKWKEIDPVAWYFHPQSMQMSLMAGFFRLSIAIKDLHNMMTAQYGIPVWGSYTIFALATIFFGLILGLVLVCMCDFLWPPKAQNAPPQNGRVIKPQQPGNTENAGDESDVVEDDRYDPLEPQVRSQQDGTRPKSAAARRRVVRTD